MANFSENPFRPMPGARPRVPLRPPTPEERDKKRREKQLQLGVHWAERRITRERLQERGVRLTEADLDRYRMVTKNMQAMKGSEESGWCEWLFLEGSDGEGGVTNSKYEWFGKQAVAYNPNKIDDVLHRTDAVMMFYDPDVKKKAYPVAVDVASALEMQYQDATKTFGDKIRKDFDRLHPARTELSDAYWIDTESDEAGEAIADPKEGRIKTLQVSVYLPSSFAEKYRDEKTSVRDADALMRRLRPFVVEQMRIEMEAQALYVLGDLRFEKIAEGIAKTRIHSREDLIARMAEVNVHGMQKRAIDILSHVLPTIWDASMQAGDMDAELAGEFPLILRRMDFLSKPEIVVSAAE